MKIAFPIKINKYNAAYIPAVFQDDLNLMLDKY